MNSKALVQESRETLEKGSKSFSFATLLFSKEIQKSVYFLYRWCRHCDDVTDGSQLGFHQNPEGLEAHRVTQLKEATHLAIREDRSITNGAFVAFGEVARKHGIPSLYADDLLQGMQHDAEGGQIRTRSDLLVYCYQVAGTVGLMMCHIMGLKDSRALKYAVDLGIALQMTNIARDVSDDFRVGKIYLPEDWLVKAGIPSRDLLAPAHSENLHQVVTQLLSEADLYYQSGLRGLNDLPWRAALAVAIAASVYRAIGIQVLKQGSSGRGNRAVLNRLQKMKAAASGISLLLPTLPERIFRPRPIRPILEIWRYS